MNESNESQTMKDISCGVHKRISRANSMGDDRILHNEMDENDEYKDVSNNTTTSTEIPNDGVVPTQVSKKPTKKNKPPKPIHFDHIEYFTTVKDQIHEYKLTELRDIVKYRKIKGARTKQECVTKIDEYFVKFVNAIKIQRIYRGFLVRHFFRVKGGMNIYNIIQRCVNETDFYTLEPLTEIKIENLFIVKEMATKRREALSLPKTADTDDDRILQNERIAGANSVGDDRIFQNERIAGANSVGDDRIFQNGMKENGMKENGMKENVMKENEMKENEIKENIDVKVESAPDNTHFYYGFNINSLITLYRKSGSIQNPYNRRDFTIETIQNIFTHYPIMCILFKENTADDNLIDNIVPFRVPTKFQINTLFTHSSTNTNTASNTHVETNTSTTANRTTANYSSPQRRRPPTRSSRNRNTIVAETGVVNNGDAVNTYISMFHNITSFNTTTSHELDTIRTAVNIFKQQPLSVRINELFMYIDQLGNYTDSAWFSQLNKRKYYIFYSQLRELWAFRAQMPVYVKNNICPLGDPFLNSVPVFRKPYDQITEEEICISSLDAMENIIMTSLDVEYRKIGCLHVLTALTYVCPETRVQYGFLVE
jgi:hypothetical protein